MNVKGEWFRCNVNDVRSAIKSLSTGLNNLEGRQYDFPMRPEQKLAVEKTSRYFKTVKNEENSKTHHFLWNAKMRFGKTFAAYQLALEMGWKKILVMTFKPAVQNAWEQDLSSHIDFIDWQFVARGNKNFDEIDFDRPFVCFGSFQDFLGKNALGGIKSKNEWVHNTNWDCVIFDEYHYGAWRETAKELFEAEDLKEIKEQQGECIDIHDEESIPIKTDYFLYLSGTPFRALESGEFIEEQIFNWTYSDEQKAKNEWSKDNNPYEELPRMVLMTYQLPDSIKEIAIGGEFDEFDLNIFFQADGLDREAKFKYENEVQKWLDLIRGQYLETMTDQLKMGSKKPPFPFSDRRLLSLLNHTFWFLPTVSACYAMRNLCFKIKMSFFMIMILSLLQAIKQV